MVKLLCVKIIWFTIEDVGDAAYGLAQISLFLIALGFLLC